MHGCPAPDLPPPSVYSGFMTHSRRVAVVLLQESAGKFIWERIHRSGPHLLQT